MKKYIGNIFATTGISLLLLSIIALIFQAKSVCLQTVFQVLETNIIVHFCLYCLSKLEIKYPLMEMFIQISLTVIIPVVFGSFFQWFVSTPIWILIFMGIVIYIVSAILNLFSMKQEAKEINALIKKRNSKNGQ